MVLLTHWSPTVRRDLWFDLSPNRLLTVARYRMPPADGPLVERTSTSGFERIDRVRLSPAAFADIRGKLALFRPEALGLGAPFVLPEGCHYVFDVGEEVSITYVGPHDQSGAFTSQGERVCNHGSVNRLEEALREILTSLPRTQAAEGFIW